MPGANHTPYHDQYDPDLHGEITAPAAQRGYAMALTVAVVVLPFVLWALLT